MMFMQVLRKRLLEEKMVERRVVAATPLALESTNEKAGRMTGLP